MVVFLRVIIQAYDSVLYEKIKLVFVMTLTDFYTMFTYSQ